LKAAWAEDSSNSGAEAVSGVSPAVRLISLEAVKHFDGLRFCAAASFLFKLARYSSATAPNVV